MFFPGFGIISHIIGQERGKKEIFGVLGGGDHHLFWFFGHPEVYILIISALEVGSIMKLCRNFNYLSVIITGVALWVLIPGLMPLHSL